MGQAAEDFHDRGGIERRERKELSVGRENASGDQGMSVWIEVGAIGAEGLTRLTCACFFMWTAVVRDRKLYSFAVHSHGRILSTIVLVWTGVF